MRQKDTRVD